MAIDCTLANGNLTLSSSEDRRVLDPTLLTPAESSNDSIATDTPNDEELLSFITHFDLIEGGPNTGQLIDDENIIAYNFPGEADEVIVLKYISIRNETYTDLWLRAPDGEMIFTSSLLLADTLSMRVNLPQTGDYQIFFTLTDRPQPADAVFTIEVERQQ